MRLLLVALTAALLTHSAAAQDDAAETPISQGAPAEIPVVSEPEPDSDADTTPDPDTPAKPDMDTDEGADKEAKPQVLRAEGDTPTNDENESQPALSGAIKIEDTGSNGAMIYSVPMEVPKFHGIEPALGLSYNSQDRSHGTSGPVIGVGWKLSGISAITRHSGGGGAPTYRDKDDMYRLDGQDLMACKDSAATKKYAPNYHPHYQSDRASVSCKTGGQLVAMRNDFNRIKMTTVSYNGRTLRNFHVTSPDGVTRIYKPAGQVAGLNLGTGDARARYAYHRKFLLVEIRDAKQNANRVTYDYMFRELAHGLSERVVHIRYSGYDIRFHHDKLTYPQKHFALGVPGYSGKVHDILRTVSIMDRSGKVRAYKLGEQVSDTTSQRKLRSVQQFGRDFTMANGRITGGTALPPYVFDYTAGVLSFAAKTFTGKAFHPYGTLADLDGDGRTDILNFKSSYDGKWSFPKQAFEVQRDRTGVSSGMRLPELTGDATSSQRNNTGWGYRQVWVPGYTETRYRMQYVCEYVYFPTFQQVCGYQNVPYQHYVNGRYESQWVSYTYQTGSSSQSMANILMALPQAQMGGKRGFLTLTSTSSYSWSNDWPGGYNHGGAAMTLKLIVDDGSKLVTKATVTREIGGCKYGTSNGQDPVLVGQFDRDLLPEIVYGESLYHVTPTNLVKSTALTAGLSRYCDEAHDGAMALDLDGDGIDEIIADDRYWRIEDGKFVERALSNSPIRDGRIFQDDGDESRLRRAGDVNGDGTADVVFFDRGKGIKVYLSHGSGFLPPVTWAGEAAIDAYGFLGDDYGAVRTQLVDLNNDGLDDLILHQGYADDTGKLKNKSQSTKAHILISTGSGFVKYNGPHATISAFLGAADVDGDGQVDLIRQGANGVVYFNNAGPRNLLKSIVTPLKGEASIWYVATSHGTHVADDRIPGVQHVVGRIDQRDGRGQSQRSDITYLAGRYSTKYRRSMGYGRVRPSLPKLSSETETPLEYRWYYNDHPGSSGVMYKRQRNYEGVMQSRQTLSHDRDTSGKGPFTTLLTQDISGARFGSSFYWTTKRYAVNEYGHTYAEINLGPTNSAGVDLTSSDNFTLRRMFSPNTSKFITALPRREYVLKGTDTATGDRARWLSSKTFYYDEVTTGDRANDAPPLYGNLTSVKQWNGNPASNWHRLQEERRYTGRGLLRLVTDARGNTTRTYYDATRSLFPVREVNALGHETTRIWNQACQSETSRKDANGLTVSTTYDALCRIDRKTHPNGFYEQHSYKTGSATNQYHQVSSPSASTVSGKTTHTKRDYLDGLGRTWKTARSGDRGTSADFIWHRIHNGVRNSVAQESLALTAAEAALATIPSNKRTSHGYDAQDRRVRTVYANGASQTIEYTVASKNGVTLYTANKIRDVHCHDAPEADTICGQVVQAYDSRGNMVSSTVTDQRLQDVGNDGTKERVTRFTFDRLNRMTRVYDPIGKVWRFSYDGFGNKIEQDDPSLGVWTMTYDANDNLVRQTDAKGQTITFAYDKLDRVTSKVVRSNKPTVTTTHVYDQPRPNAYNIGHKTMSRVTGHEVRYDYDKIGKIAREWNVVGGRTYVMHTQYRKTGDIARQHLPVTPGGTGGAWMPYFQYDAANRLTGMDDYILGITYTIEDAPHIVTLRGGATEERRYSGARRFLERIDTLKDGARVDRVIYRRSAAGRIRESYAQSTGSWTEYTYDYANRLLRARDTDTTPNAFFTGDRRYTYDAAGRMRSNSTLGSYSYTGTPVAFAPKSVAGTTLSYDANGNMTRGFDGRVMTYDGENRPLSVTRGNFRTEYVYGATGARLKRSVTDLTTGTIRTDVMFGPVQIRNFDAAGERVITQPHERVQLSNGSNVRFFMRDHLGSVRSVFHRDGSLSKRANYEAFGKPIERVYETRMANDDESFIGEAWDAEAGLHYLNARYYDSTLGLFLQPDWLDVTDVKVGTNRYSYALNNPVNFSDPTGNIAWFGAAVGAVVGVVVQGGIDIYNGELSSASTYAGAAVGGAVVGATAGLGGATFAGQAAMGVGSGALGGASAQATTSVLSGQPITAADVGRGAAFGAAGGALGVGVSRVGSNWASSLPSSAPRGTWSKGSLGETMTRIQYGAMGYRSLPPSNAKIPTGGLTPTGRVQMAHYDHAFRNVFTRHFRINESKFGPSAALSYNQTAAQPFVPGGLTINRHTPLSFGSALSTPIRAGSIGFVGTGPQ